MQKIIYFSTFLTHQTDHKCKSDRGYLINSLFCGSFYGFVFSFHGNSILFKEQ